MRALPPAPAATLSVREALSLFTAQLEADGRSPHTVAQAARQGARLAAWAEPEGLADVAAITHADLAQYLRSDVARLRADGAPRKPASLNITRSFLRVFFEYLADTGLVARSPARHLRRAIVSEGPPRGLSPAEERRLVEHLRTQEGTTAARDRTLFLTMLWGGLRIGSAVSLEVEDVDLDAGELYLRRAKGGRSERVVMGEQLARELQAYLEGTGLATGALFPARHGGAMTTRHARRQLELAFRRAGIDRRFSPHSLRHTCATRLYERTGDPFLVKEALRHRCLASSLRYVRVDRGRLRTAMR